MKRRQANKPKAKARQQPRRPRASKPYVHPWHREIVAKAEAREVLVLKAIKRSQAAAMNYELPRPKPFKAKAKPAPKSKPSPKRKAARTPPPRPQGYTVAGWEAVLAQAKLEGRKIGQERTRKRVPRPVVLTSKGKQAVRRKAVPSRSMLPVKMQQQAETRGPAFKDVKAERHLIEKRAVDEMGRVLKNDRGLGSKAVIFQYRYSDNPQVWEPELSEAEAKKKGKAQIAAYKARKVGNPLMQYRAAGADLVHEASAYISTEGRIKGQPQFENTRQTVEFLLKGFRPDKSGLYEVRVEWRVYDSPERLKELEGGNVLSVRIPVSDVERGYDNWLWSRIQSEMGLDAVDLGEIPKDELGDMLMDMAHDKAALSENPDAWERAVGKLAKKEERTPRQVFQQFKREMVKEGLMPSTSFSAYLTRSIINWGMARKKAISNVKKFKDHHGKPGKKAKGSKRRTAQIPESVEQAVYSEMTVKVYLIS